VTLGQRFQNHDVPDRLEGAGLQVALRPAGELALMALVGAFSIEWGIGALVDLLSTSGRQRAKRALGRSAVVRGGFASISATEPR
jgi:hypothetical protein